MNTCAKFHEDSPSDKKLKVAPSFWFLNINVPIFCWNHVQTVSGRRGSNFLALYRRNFDQIACVFYYRKRGSASYIVREWLLWEGERERERDACDVIRYHAEIASDHAYLDGASTQRVDAFWACRGSSVHALDKELNWCLSARAAGNGRVIYEWRWEV